MSSFDSSRHHNIGAKWSSAIPQAADNPELAAMYTSQSGLIHSIISKHIEEKQLSKVRIVDLGGADGQLLMQLRAISPWSVETIVTCVDIDEKNIANNKVADDKVIADLSRLPFSDNFDIGLVRYVLQYNPAVVQLEIAKSIRAVLKEGGICINWCCGASDRNHQNILNEVFRNCPIPLLRRPDCHWSTNQEMRQLFSQAGFFVTNITDYRVPIKDLFVLRYDISEEENNYLLNALGDYAYLDYSVFTAEVLNVSETIRNTPLVSLPAPEEGKVISNGIELRTSAWKNCTGTPVVMVHGIAHARQTFQKLAAAISAENPVVTYDIRGHGTSHRNLEGQNYAHKQFSDDLKNVVISEFNEPTIVIASSLSALHAIQAASENASLFKALVLIDLLPDIDSRILHKLRLPFREKEYYSYTDILSWYGDFNGRMTLNEREEELRHTAAEIPNGQWDYVYDHSVMDIVNENDIVVFNSHVSGIRCPVLLIRGVRSKLVPDSAIIDFKARLSPEVNFHFHDVPNEGHCPWQASPDDVYTAISKFFKEIK